MYNYFINPLGLRITQTVKPKNKDKLNSIEINIAPQKSLQYWSVWRHISENTDHKHSKKYFGDEIRRY